MPAPAPGKLDKESLKHLAAAPGKFLGNGVGIGPDRTIIDTPAAAPVSGENGKHQAATPGKLPKGFGGIGPGSTIIYAPGTALPPGASGKLDPFPGGGIGVGPEVHSPIKPGHNDVESAKGPAASAKKEPSSHHDPEFIRKAAIGGALSGAALTTAGVAGSVYAYKKYGKGRGKVDAEESPVFQVATESGKLPHQQGNGHTHHEAGPSHHKEVISFTHHKRDLSRVLLFEETTPAPAFHMTCLGQDCNAEVKTSNQLLWQPQTEWPVEVLSEGRSSALQDLFTHSEAVLMKRSPVFGFAFQSFTEIAAPQTSFSTAYAPAIPGVQWHTAPSYVTHEDAPRMPVNLGSFTRPELQGVIQGDRGRQGPSSRIGGRRAGPASPTTMRKKKTKKPSESRRGLLSADSADDSSLASPPQNQHEAKDRQVAAISQPPSHQDHRHLSQQADVTLVSSQEPRLHHRQHAPDPSPMVQSDGRLSPYMSAFGKSMLGIFGVVGMTGAYAAGVACGRECMETRERETRTSHPHIQQVQLGSGRHRIAPLPHERPPPVKRDLSTAFTANDANFNIASARSLFRDADALHSRKSAR